MQMDRHVHINTKNMSETICYAFLHQNGFFHPYGQDFAVHKMFMTVLACVGSLKT